MDLTDICRTFQPTAADYFSSAHRTFSRTDHMLGHKTSLSNFKKTETIPRILSDHNGMKVEINKRGKLENS